MNTPYLNVFESRWIINLSFRFEVNSSPVWSPISKVIKPLNIEYHGIEKEKDFYDYSIKSL